MEGEGDTRGEEDVRGYGAAGGMGRQIIRWERFLPRRSLRVLLVEYDDSTRHIVTALLRKCGYRVAAVADGLQAWEVLKERHYGFDLVLTEVMTPSLSGIGLLTKVMASEACRNIPVIMMSSHDSVSVVYTCMLKGAVDFLVKPIRKNELQNLWQHVWRRHCSSSYANASDNDAASNCISSNAGSRSNAGKKSDEETDAQSSESKPDSEIRSVRKPMEPNLAEQESCSRKMEEKPQQPINGITKETNAWKMENSGGRKGKSAEIGVELIAPIREACLAEEVQNWNIYCRTSPYRNGVEDSVFLKSREDCGSHHKENAPDEPPQRVVCYVKPIANGQCSNAISEQNTHNSEALCAATKVPSTKNASDFSSSSPLEFSWRRPQQNGCVSQEFKARHILIHSDASAFSRYGEKRIHPTSQKVVSSVLHITRRECDDRGHSNVHNHDKYHSNVHSYGTDDKKNTGFPSREMLSYSKGNEGEATVCFKASSGGNREEAGILSSGPQQEDASGNHASTGKVAAFHQAPLGFISLPIPVGAVPYQSLCAQYGAILHPMFHAEASLMQHCPDATDMPHKKIPCDQFVQQDNHPVHNNSSFNFQPHDDNHQSYHTRQPHDKEAGGPNSFSCTPVDPANQSGSCSQDVLNGVGRNGSGETTDATGNTGTALENGNESGIENCNQKAAECDPACREAALIKFRLKRKDRCFEKRVRYYSRKKLAEQRPRVKGQFVCQKVPDSMAATEADN